MRRKFPIQGRVMTDLDTSAKAPTPFLCADEPQLEEAVEKRTFTDGVATRGWECCSFRPRFSSLLLWAGGRWGFRRNTLRVVIFCTKSPGSRSAACGRVDYVESFETARLPESKFIAGSVTILLRVLLHSFRSSDSQIIHVTFPALFMPHPCAVWKVQLPETTVGVAKRGWHMSHTT